MQRELSLATVSCKRAVRTGKNHIILILSSPHPDFPDDLWNRLLPYAEITLKIMRPWRPDPSLSAWSGLHRLTYDFSATLSILLVNSVLPSPVPNTATLGPITGIALLLLAHSLPTTAANGSMSSPPALNASPSPSLFHFAESYLPPPPHSDPSSTRPSPTLGGTDLIGRVDPDFGLCHVIEVGPPHRLAPDAGNLDPIGHVRTRIVRVRFCTSLYCCPPGPHIRSRLVLTNNHRYVR